MKDESGTAGQAGRRAVGQSGTAGQSGNRAVGQSGTSYGATPERDRSRTSTPRQSGTQASEPSETLHLKADSIARNGDPVHVSPERAGWTYTGLDVLRLQEGERRVIDVGARELLVLPLSGECVVQVDDRRFDLAGRHDVFDGVADFVYAGAQSHIELSSRTGGEFALPWARATQSFPPAYCAANDVNIEERGAGRASRHIHNLFTHDVGTAERLVVVEVLTPPGNWSSWPPHKHDDASSGEEDE